jgi:hypothetical protein
VTKPKLWTGTAEPAPKKGRKKTAEPEPVYEPIPDEADLPPAQTTLGEDQ